MKRLRVVLAVLSTILWALPTATASAAATSYTCTGGSGASQAVIPPGTYQSLTVAGVCAIPSGTVTVLGSVAILPGASLTAIKASQVTIGGNVSVGTGGILVLGCGPSINEGPEALCANTTSYSIGGNLGASQPLAVILHSDWIGGNVSIQGGGGGTNCDSSAALSAAFGIPVPALPAFSAVENDFIAGNLAVSGMHSCWLGFQRNTIHRSGSPDRGNVSLTDNRIFLPDSIEFSRNTVYGNLACSGNSNVTLDVAAGGGPNTVLGKASGQCANLQ